MSGRVLHFESPAHREADALLPWYANGTLADEERGKIEAHLAECARCQRELEWLRELQVHEAAPVATADHADADATFSRLRERINAHPGRRALARLRALKEGWARAPAWTRWALAAQCVLCLALAGVLALTDRAPAPYHTLGTGRSSEGADARLVIAFDPSLSESRLRTMLSSNDAQIVEGPTDAGAYVVAVPRARAAQALAALRKDPGVRMAVDLSPPRGR